MSEYPPTLSSSVDYLRYNTALAFNLNFHSKRLGSVDLSRLNFVRDKIVLGEARRVSPGHSKQIRLNKA